MLEWYLQLEIPKTNSYIHVKIAEKSKSMKEAKRIVVTGAAGTVYNLSIITVIRGDCIVHASSFGI